MSFTQQIEEVSIRLLMEPACKHIPVSATPYISDVFSSDGHTVITFMATVPVAVCQGPSPTAAFPVVDSIGNDVIPAGNKVRAVVSAGCRFSAVSQSAGVMYLTNEGGI